MSPEEGLFRRAEGWLHGKSLGLLGLVPEDRARVVELMLERRRDAVGYWLLLMISTGIATLGLALGSTAVVIGAMLIAPLMGPIVELGMALVVGSPALTLRALMRTVGSVLAVIAGAAALTLLLPFQEITPEISARTFPTALDLLIAVFVALIAVLTTARSSSESTSAAAGTAIGIALVPPVCVIGYGLGIGNLAVAGGATLLFITNLVAILFISVLSFLAMGFERVDSRDFERQAILDARPGGVTMRALRGLEHVFGSRYSRVLRVGTPALLIGLTYMPLSTSLDQVAWEVRSRAAVSRILGSETSGRRAVQTSTTVARRAIGVQMYLVGGPETAAELRETISNRIAAETGVIPTLDIIAVPDAEAIRSATATSAPARTEAPPASRIPEIRTAVRDALASAWPAELGALVAWRLVIADHSDAPIVEVDYLGERPGPATEVLVARLLADRVGTTLRVQARAISPAAATEPPARGAEWLPAFLEAAQRSADAPALHACVTVPTGRSAAERQQVERIATLVRSEAERRPRMAVAEGGAEWSVQLRAGSCAPGEAAELGADGGPTVGAAPGSGVETGTRAGPGH